jgi:hypothetical protein
VSRRYPWLFVAGLRFCSRGRCGSDAYGRCGVGRRVRLDGGGGSVGSVDRLGRRAESTISQACRPGEERVAPGRPVGGEYLDRSKRHRLSHQRRVRRGMVENRFRPRTRDRLPLRPAPSLSRLRLGSSARRECALNRVLCFPLPRPGDRTRRHRHRDHVLSAQCGQQAATGPVRGLSCPIARCEERILAQRCCAGPGRRRSREATRARTTVQHKSPSVVPDWVRLPAAAQAPWRHALHDPHSLDRGEPFDRRPR